MKYELNQECANAVFEAIFGRDEQFAKLLAKAAITTHVEIAMDMSQDGGMESAYPLEDIRIDAGGVACEAFDEMRDMMKQAVKEIPIDYTGKMVYKAHLKFPD